MRMRKRMLRSRYGGPWVGAVGVTIVMAATAASAQEVEIPEGFEIIEIDKSKHFAGFPDINNCGQIVFDKQLGPDFEDKEIFLYDNGQITRLTHDNVSDRIADINDSGTIIWLRNNSPEPGRGETEIALWKDGGFSVFAETSDTFYSADLGNGGEIAFAEKLGQNCPRDVRMFLWDGQTIRQISLNDGLTNQSADLNDHVDVVWGHANTCINPWQGDIQLWRNGGVETLPSQFIQVANPAINNTLQIVWFTDGGTELWENGQTRLLDRHGGVPEINNSGDISYYRENQERPRYADKWLYRAWEERFYRLTDSGHNSVGNINDWGEVVWTYSRTVNTLAGGWRFLRRIRTGDAQFDDSIDLLDYNALADCITGPGSVDSLCECRFLDVDHDGDVDLGDFARFQNAFQCP